MCRAAVCPVAFSLIPSRSLQHEWAHLSVLRALAISIPLPLLENGHSSASVVEEWRKEMKAITLSISLILQKCWRPFLWWQDSVYIGRLSQIAWVDRQPTHCQNDPEALLGRNDHSMEIVNLINVRSETRCKISCQRGRGWRRRIIETAASGLAGIVALWS